MTRICVLLPICVVGFTMQLSSVAVAQGLQAMSARAEQCLEALIGGNVIRTQSVHNPRIGGNDLTFNRAGQEYIGIVTSSRIVIRRSGVKNPMPERTGPFPYAERVKAIQKVSPLLSVYRNHTFAPPKFNTFPDRAAGQGMMVGGRSTVTYHIMRNGYQFIDRVYGFSASFDIKTGELFMYTEELVAPQTGAVAIELTQAEARQAAAAKLNVAASTLVFTGLGWRKGGSAEGRIAYGFERTTPSDRPGLSEKKTIYINAETGADMGGQTIFVRSNP